MSSNNEDIPQEQETEEEESTATGTASADTTGAEAPEGDPPIIIQGGGSGTSG